MTRNINRTLATILILVSILYCIPTGFRMIATGDDLLGLGLVGLVVIFLTLLFLVPSIGSWRSKNKNPRTLLVINSIGVVWVLFWFRTLYAF